MPASAACTKSEDLVESLSSLDTMARLKALRDVKNQIIGNKTKKLSYIKLGAVPRVVEILASDSDVPLLVQSAAAVGSFACGNDVGVKALLESGVLPHLLKMLSNSNSQVVEAGARSLKMIFQSTLAPKNDMFQGRRVDLILALLNGENDNVAEVAASVLARCCETEEHQKVLAEAGCLQSLIGLLGGSVKKREAALDALAALTRGNQEISSLLIDMEQGNAVACLIKLIKEKSPRTRLFACMCLLNIAKACSSGYQQEWDIKKCMLSTVVKLFEELGQVGEEAPGVLADLVTNNEELQKAAYEINAVEKLAEILHRGVISVRQLEGVLLAIAELCSRLEDGRRQILNLQGQYHIGMALESSTAGVRIAACSCIKSISRSVKNLRTSLTEEHLVRSLFKLLDDPSPLVQVSALGAASNIVLDFTPHKAVFFNCGGVSQLIQLARSMDSVLRQNAVWALRNLLYLADMMAKERVMRELTFSTLVDLICDSEEIVQEQALAFVRNLVYGSVECVQLIFAQDGAILHAVERQLCGATRPEVCVQGVYVLSNVAAGSEHHKEAIMEFVSPIAIGDRSASILLRFLQDMSNPQIRVAAVWCIMNLIHADSPGVMSRVLRLHDAGIQLQLQKMAEDPILDVKDRVRAALEQFSALGTSA
ncbi:hypothetical protein O6H91_Y307900 [Diphasiastrum complanatum]|nr:hypothetical protein O6H91_Y307900 [Diphasiastrum complanatum]KAJ7299086.1 hypothetical protein O6H91_Y307900 [Diphasiastrum complanatum]KAJ7299087.1 hypothetical protein O6H91_Y307900 [Diphasiastrum complanatum]KAJ7299089.1 hypothetical protein O6H91_Y307900 [Diphasiastrum complanatum]KAJ7299090.1 hypothetical protein O6H91_Y307900 [Diphasiastrum complanatum]